MFFENFYNSLIVASSFIDSEYNYSVAASSKDEYGIFLPIILFLAFAIGTYFGIYLYYRNTNKRYKYEQTTETEVFDAKHGDHYSGRRTGLRSSRISGENS